LFPKQHRPGPDARRNAEMLPNPRAFAEMTDDDPEMDTVWIFPAGADLSFFNDQPERVAEIAIRAFARAVKQAIQENDRVGIPSYGSKDGKVVVRQLPRKQSNEP
jgi:hypothetical protein